MSQWKEAFYDTFFLLKRQIFSWKQWKETEVEMYVYIHKSYQNLPNMGCAKIESILTILKIIVKAKLYSKLFTKNDFNYFLKLTF